MFFFILLLIFYLNCTYSTKNEIYLRPAQAPTMRRLNTAPSQVKRPKTLHRFEESGGDEDTAGFVAPTVPQAAEEDTEGFVAPTVPVPIPDDTTAAGKTTTDPLPAVPAETTKPTETETSSTTPVDTNIITNNKTKDDHGQLYYDVIDVFTSWSFIFAAIVVLIGSIIIVYVRCLKPSVLRWPDENAVYSQLSVFDPADDDELDETELAEMNDELPEK